MAVRTADAEWRGNLAQGSGQIRLGSGTFEGPYDFRSRIADGKGSNLKELRQEELRSRGPCPTSIFLCEPGSCELPRLDIVCAWTSVWRASPVVTTE
jgi:hypothetical protein